MLMNIFVSDMIDDVICFKDHVCSLEESIC